MSKLHFYGANLESPRCSLALMTAIAGEDANWGRVVMAVRKAGEPADGDRLSIWFGGIRVAHKGARDDSYDEAKVSAVMKEPKIALKVALGLGKGGDRVLTCDLTKDYSRSMPTLIEAENFAKKPGQSVGYGQGT